jgi:hypothetical protein
MKPSKTLLNKLLSESSFDPRSPGPYKPIVDMNDPKFLRQRAMELLHEAEWSDSDLKMKQAISFLALARCLVQKSPEPGKKPRPAVNPNTRPADLSEAIKQARGSFESPTQRVAFAKDSIETKEEIAIEKSSIPKTKKQFN